jgi:hypothetical protein
MSALLTRDSPVHTGVATDPVLHAIGVLRRDLARTLAPAAEDGSAIRLVLDEDAPRESYDVRVLDGELVLTAGDDLGFVYGIYEISEVLLGVPPFWFWNDHRPALRASVEIGAGFHRRSTEAAVRLRGWFVNDEVLLNSWSIGGDTLAPWEMTFEALLRLRGNLVIPGTDQASVLQHIDLATQMGLAIAQHHAEPLGAEMFIRAHPGLAPSYAENSELFHRLWLQSIESKRDHRIVWNLGFRGQGDKPFWADDPSYDTDEARGALVSEVIRIQYDMLKRVIPDAEACIYLYGETLELLRAGVLDFPDDLIKIWADNGYGRMVTRRQENNNPRLPAFAEADDSGSNGIYYHASFYDLQAANHITMLPNRAERIEAELRSVLAHCMDDLWVVNCSNVRPHVYMLDLIARSWRDGAVDVSEHREEYATTYFGSDAAPAVSAALDAYAGAAVRFGAEWDEHAGEQFANHVPRVLVSQYLRDRTVRADELRWLTVAADLRGQLEALLPLFERGVDSYTALDDAYSAAALTLPPGGRKLFESSLLAQARVHRHDYRGASLACRALLSALDGDLQQAFLHADQARRSYLLAHAALRGAEEGVWLGFFANDSLADIEQSAWVLEGLERYLRIIGDGPYFYEWQRRYLYDARDAEVLLVLRLEKTVDDARLALLMEARAQE